MGELIKIVQTAALVVALVGCASGATANSLQAIATTQGDVASFGLYFPTEPDFTVVNNYSATAFQFYIDPDREATYPGQYLFRRTEDTPQGSVAIIQVQLTRDGWGPLLATVPLVQDHVEGEGYFVGFTVPLVLFTTQHDFYWALDVFAYGETVHWDPYGRFSATGHAVEGPVPTAVPDDASSALLLGFALWGLAVAFGGRLVPPRSRRRVDPETAWRVAQKDPRRI